MKKMFIAFAMFMICSLMMWANGLVPTRFDERMDLMAVIWRMAGAREYNQCPISPYVNSVDSTFKPFASHEAVTLAKRYMKKKGVGYDAVASLAAHLKLTDEGMLIIDEDIASDIDDRWSTAMQKEFIIALNDFYKMTEFHKWFVENEPIQKKCLDAFSEISGNIDLDWFAQTFDSGDANFNIILCPLAGMNNYGISTRHSDGTNVLSPVISCSKYDNGAISYESEEVLPIVIHEFCHAYCNPIIDKRWNSIAKKAEEAFRIKKRILSQQAYVTAKIMMYETLVRTSVIRYEQQHNSNTDVWQLIDKEEELGFILVADFLKAWNQNHASNPGDILTESINNFSTEAYWAKVAEEEKRSVNYTCNITDGEKNVASGDFTFTITFDRQMEPGISIGQTEFDFPDFKAYSWSEDATTLSIVFHFEPNHTYGLVILGKQFLGKDGNRSTEKTICFKTGK